MNLIINTVGGQLLTLTPEMLQEKLGLKSDILSLGIEVSDGNTAITAQSYTKWECAGDTICPLIDVNVKNGGKEMQAAMFQLPTPEIPAPFCRLYDEQGSDEEDWFSAASFSPRSDNDGSKHPVFVDDGFGKPVLASRTVTESFLPGARPARNCLTSMSRSHKIAEFAFNTANLCMTGSCLRAAPFFVPFSLHILANRIDWYLGRCFHP